MENQRPKSHKNKVSNYLYLYKGSTTTKTNNDKVFIAGANEKKLKTFSNLDVSNIFKTKSVGWTSSKNNIMKNHDNYVGVSKHFVPSILEWQDSVYTYNKNTVKLLPPTDTLTFNLIKSYLNFYNKHMEKNARSIRARRRLRIKSINKTLLGKPCFKHTNDNVNIMVYIYNRRMRYYLNKLVSTNTMDNIRHIRNNAEKDYKGESLYKILIKNLKSKLFKITPLISKHQKVFANNIILNKHLFLLKKYKTLYLKRFIEHYMRDEINSIVIRQLYFIQKSKLNKFYLLPLVTCLERLYSKKVTFTFINLKRILNNAGVLSAAIVTKLRNRMNGPVKVLTKSLNMLELPNINKLALRGEKANNKKKNYIIIKESLGHCFNSDLLEQFIANNKKSYANYKNNIEKVISLLKYKATYGIRFEVAGRLTKRNTAQRSMFKTKYKGNTRNMDSSYKGLSTTLLRGFANSNVSYNQSKSKLRIGSFGLKTWISSRGFSSISLGSAVHKNNFIQTY